MKAKDLTGEVFGSLTVIEKAESYGSSRWKCKCNCGKEITVYGTNLTNGKTQSCGCGKGKHGESRSKLYNVYHQLVRRGVVPEWNDYKNFKEWAITSGYVEGGCRVSKIDASKPYSPENCKLIVKTTDNPQTQ